MHELGASKRAHTCEADETESGTSFRERNEQSARSSMRIFGLVTGIFSKKEGP